MALLLHATFLLLLLNFAHADLLCQQNWLGGCDDRGCGGRCQRVGLGDCVCGATGVGVGLGVGGGYLGGIYPPGQAIVPAAVVSDAGSLSCVSSGYSGCVNSGGYCSGYCYNSGVPPNNICQCRVTNSFNSFNSLYGSGYGYGSRYGLSFLNQGSPIQVGSTGGCVSEGINGCVGEGQGCGGRCVNYGVPPNNQCYCEYGFGNGYGLGRK